jgi:hypothetical protein
MESGERMSYGILADFIRGPESASSGDGEPAFRCGPALPLARWPIRGADPRPLAAAPGRGRTNIPIDWAPEVVWRKRVRRFK